MKVSVIVPVYNAEKYLIERVGNLLNQTLDEIEIIFIDDASTDGTLSILEAAKNQFPNRVRVLSHKENKGPGAARNMGLAVASGEYIGFYDADDVIDVTMYEYLPMEMKDTLEHLCESFEQLRQMVTLYAQNPTDEMKQLFANYLATTGYSMILVNHILDTISE